MTLKDFTELLAAFAAITTSVVAVGAYGRYLHERRVRRRRLENFLKDGGNFDRRHFSIFELMATLRMTETQIIEAGFASDKIRCAFPAYWNGPAESLIFEYQESNEERQALRF